MDVARKNAIVTGASSGIGLATAKLLASRGAKVALVARSRSKLEGISHLIRGSIVSAADMSKPFEIRRIVSDVAARFGRIDVPINNAGVGYDAPVELMDVDTFHYVFDLDLVGPIVAMEQVIPVMRRQHHTHRLRTQHHPCDSSAGKRDGTARPFPSRCGRVRGPTNRWRR